MTITTKKISQPLKLANPILFEQYQETKSLEIRNEIMEINMGLVHQEVIHWMNKCSESYEDLVQIGAIGLIRAIERFDLQKESAFSSFAAPYIRGEIQHYLRDTSNSIKIPRHFLELKRKSYKVIRELREKLNRLPTDSEIAKEIGISMEEWQDVKLADENKTLISLDVTISDKGKKAKLEDLVTDEKYQSFQLAQEDKIRLDNLLVKLEDRTRKVLEFVFLEDLTKKQTAKELNVSVGTVTRDIKQGIEKMKNMVKGEEFE